MSGRIFKKYQVMPKIRIGNLEAYAEVKADGKHFYIAKEVGHWEKIDGVFFCSVCERSRTHTSNYCPNCGAKMKEE